MNILQDFLVLVGFLFVAIPQKVYNTCQGAESVHEHHGALNKDGIVSTQTEKEAEG